MIGERLKKYRKKCGVGQQELADKLSMPSYKTISAYERGLYEPPDEVKVFFAKEFNISLDYLLGATDCEINLDRSNQFALPDGFPERYKAQLYEYAEFLMQKEKRLKDE